MTQSSTIPSRTVTGATALRVVPTLLAALLLALSGCGQQRPAKTEIAKTAAADSITQGKPEPTALSSQQPEPDSSASVASAAKPTQPPKPAPKVTGLAALERAAATGKDLLVLFYRDDDDSTRALRKVFASAAAKLASRANSVTINVADSAEREMVAKFGVDRAPMPLALVVAPNGAITGGFPGKVTEEQLSGAFVSPGLANCLKALQAGKLVFLCAQNASTKSNDAALQGVQAFKADARYARFTEIVSIDPADAAESKFLAQLQIDPKTSEAITAFMAPPGTVIAKYTGATDKDTMIAALTAATSGGCGTGGCGPSGCGPTK